MFSDQKHWNIYLLELNQKFIKELFFSGSKIFDPPVTRQNLISNYLKNTGKSRLKDRTTMSGSIFIYFLFFISLPLIFSVFYLLKGPGTFFSQNLNLLWQLWTLLCINIVFAAFTISIIRLPRRDGHPFNIKNLTTVKNSMRQPFHVVEIIPDDEVGQNSPHNKFFALKQNEY